MTLLQTRTTKQRKTKLDLLGICVAVWSPLGSPGKSTIALNLAYEFAELGRIVLLIDLDTYAPSLSQLLPINQPTAGLAGVARLIRQGRFTFEELDRLSAQVSHKHNKFQLLTGLGSATRWPEVTAETVQQLINIAKLNFDIVLVDLASPIEENLVSPEHVTQRNAATRAALIHADRLIVTLNGTQNLLSRYLAVSTQIDELQKSRLIVVNRSEPQPKLIKALNELTKEKVFAFIPNDEPSLQLSESQLLPLAIARRKSPARNAIATLAHKLLAWQPSIK